MPSGWHAGAHHVRNFGDEASGLILKCKCGWTKRCSYAESEPLTAEHTAQFPDDDPALVR